MKQTIVGEVTIEEIQEIQSFHLRKKSLLELQKIVTEKDDPLYDKLQIDLDTTVQSYDDWWNRMKNKYSWTVPKGNVLRIDFETGVIVCVEKE